MNKTNLLKSNKGITMLVLALTIAIMLILMVTITINLDQYAERKKKTNLENDIVKLQQEVDLYYSQVKMLPFANRYVNTEVLQNIEDSGQKSINDNDKYYVIDLDLLDEQIDLNYGKDFNTIENKKTNVSDLEDIYIVNQQSHRVYYAKGIYANGTTWYTTLKSDNVEIEDISISDIEIEANQEFEIARHTQLNAKVLPPFIKNTGMTYTSSDTTVATIDEEGVVYGLKEGTTTITLTSKDDNTVTKQYTLTVTGLHIKNADDLVLFRDFVNAGNTFEGNTVCLDADIDLSSVCYRVDGTVANDISWTPIGNATYQFEGIFEGNNNKISGLYMNRSDVRFLGFFYYAEEGTIQNLNLENCYINSTWNDASNSGYLGGISGNIANIKNCSVTGQLSFEYGENETVNTWLLSIGGITGYTGNNGTAGHAYLTEDCYNGANIKVYVKKTSSSATVVRVGGITATTNNGTIKNCYNTGNIDVTVTNTQKNVYIGGVVAESEGSGNKLTLTDSYNVGTITSSIPSGVTANIGCVFGYNCGGTHEVTNCYYLNGCGGSNTNGGIALTQDKMQTATFANILNRAENYSNSIAWTSSYQENDSYAWKYISGYPKLKWQS